MHEQIQLETPYSTNGPVKATMFQSHETFVISIESMVGVSFQFQLTRESTLELGKFLWRNA